jgi:hypothetical protein
MLMEQMFFNFYNQPWLQALLGLRASDDPPRHHPGRDSDHAAFVERRIEELRAKMDQGGPREAALRALVYVGMPEKGTDEREFEMLRRIRAQHGTEKSLDEFKQDLREQYYMLRIDESRAIELIPRLLQGHENEGPQLLEYIRQIVYADGSLGEEGQRRLAQVEKLFTQPVSA